MEGCRRRDERRPHESSLVKGTNVPRWNTTTLKERLMSHVRINPDTGCWEWTASKQSYGYGQFRKLVDGKWVIRRAHRVSYELFRGPIPDGLVLDHLCRVPGCINPEHLEPVTHKTNINRGDKGPKLQCIRGHMMTPDNIARRPDGRARCKTCHRDEVRESHRKSRQHHQGAPGDATPAVEL